MKANTPSTETRINIPAGTSLQNVVLRDGKYVPASRRIFRIRANCTPRQVGETILLDRWNNRVKFPVIMVPGFGTTTACFIPIEGGEVQY